MQMIPNDRRKSTTDTNQSPQKRKAASQTPSNDAQRAQYRAILPNPVSPPKINFIMYNPSVSAHTMPLTSTPNETQLAQAQRTPVTRLFPNIPYVEKVLWLPSETGVEGWQSLSSVPAELAADIQARIDADFLNTEAHRKIFGAMLRRQEKYMVSGMCVNNKVWTGGKRVNEWTEANGDSNWSCDACIGLKRLCARLANVDGTIKLGIYPLPQGNRRSQEWTELEYWVRD